MSRISNSLIFKCFYHSLWILLFAKILSVAGAILLPYAPMQNHRVLRGDFGHVNVVLQKIFGLDYKQIKKEVVAVKQPATLIKDMILKGVYIDKKSAYAIIKLKKRKDGIKIVSKGENFNGYKVSDIYPKRVFLKKNGKTYILYLEKADLNNPNIKQTPISSKNMPIVLNSSDVYDYVEHFDRIWKEIKIDDVRKSGKLKGFIIRWIKKDSIFTKIGLKKGDIIIKVNDRILKSYKDAFDYYEKLKRREISVLRLSVIRDNKEREIEYELF